MSDGADDPADVGEYELAGENAPADPASRVAASPARAPVLPYRRPDPAAAPLRLYFPSKPRGLFLPAALLATGMGLGFAELVHLERDAGAAARTGTIYFVMQAVFLLVAMPVLTRMAGVAFGTLPQAALKLCAIATLPTALGVGVGLLMGSCTGAILALPMGFAACWVLFAVLFELDFNESRLCASIYCAIGALVGAPLLFTSLWLWRRLL